MTDLAFALDALEIAMGALEIYENGTAFDFDRSLRGEVHFNMALSQATAKAARAKIEALAKERGE